MTTTKRNGRLGNQIIRNLAVSLIAEKNDLFVDYYNYDVIKKLGLTLFIGSKIHQNTKVLNDDNYFAVYNSKVDYNLDPNSHYFQTKEIIQLLYDYLHTDKVKSSVIYSNPFKERYNRNNDLFIHIRLTDVAHYNPGVSYYLNTIQKIQYNNIYLSTDQIDHPIIREICNKYPKMIEIIQCDEITTFQFASTCRNIILSHGSFSAIIGYLAYFSKIFYPEYEEDKIWYGDMFSIDGWNKCNHL